MISMATRLRRLGAGMALIGLLAILPPPARAACLQRPIATAAAGTQMALTIAPESEVASYLASGFSRTACPTDLRSFAAYVDRVCTAPAPAAASTTRMQAVFGRSREQLCASARAGLAEIRGK
jgi:hypothetical protein